MRNQKQLIIVVVIVLLGTGLFLLSDIRNANTQSNDNVDKNKQFTDDSDKSFPLVSLETLERAGNVDEKRRKRNEKFDNRDWVKPTANDEVTESRRVSDWQIGLPALPVKMSDVVLTGTVKSTNAFLSNDKRGVYSEFTIEVADLIKNNQVNSIKAADIVTAQRQGGRVKYPSGKILKYSISGQEMPRLNARYAFFLKYDEQADVYQIITAYEIADGKILPLDGKDKPKGSGYDGFKAFAGVNEEQFMNELRNALYTQTNPQKEKTSP